jgi:ABC-type sugar transport system permease subunit
LSSTDGATLLSFEVLTKMSSLRSLIYVIECNSIPSDLPEVATPDVASAHSHLRRIAPYLPALEPSIKVEHLLGRDTYIVGKPASQGRIARA